jgi:hypothetical protein
MAQAEQTGNPSDELPLWVTIGDSDLADGDRDPQDDADAAYIGRYATDDALQVAVEDRAHLLREHILTVIEEVRRGAAPSSETSTADERGATNA